MLYITGLRIANLIKFKVEHMQQILDKGVTKVDIIKGGTKNKQIIISPLGKQLIKANKEGLLELMNNKQSEDPFFTTSKKLDKEIDDTSLTHEVNNVLKEASIKLNKHLRSHSFRATFITDLLKKEAIQRVAKAVGHKSIGTTAIYSREKLTKENVITMLQTLDESRIKVREELKKEKEKIKAQAKENNKVIKKMFK